MDPDLWPETGTPDRTPSRGPTSGILPSRRNALEAIRVAIARGNGPVVLSGEPGVGKSLIRRKLQDARKLGGAWITVEVAPRSSVRDFYGLMTRELRVDVVGFGRPELADFLAERSLDSERWHLAVEEAHNLDGEILEEVRLLSNRLGEPDGFSGLLLVGQTRLSSRMQTRAWSGLKARLAGHVHLGRIDADEVGFLLSSLDSRRVWPPELIDRIHLMSNGRPASVLELGRQIGARLDVSPEKVRSNEIAPPSPGPRPRTGPLVGPAKPPIRVEDGLIEVGWQPDAASDLATSEEYGERAEDEGAPSDTEPEDEVEERINDHYAALQAWHEWATNQGRVPDMEGDHPAAPTEIKESVGSALEETPRVWADEEHHFAPFGRLFTRLAQENEAD
jgi:type II secretory pathway predicted ATPase ExeA